MKIERCVEYRLVYRRSGYRDMLLHLCADGTVGNPPGHAEITWDSPDSDVLLFHDARGNTTAELSKIDGRYRGLLFGRVYVELFEGPQQDPVARRPGPMRYLLAIPYVNRYDLLRAAIDSVPCFHDRLILIDNSITTDLKDSELSRVFEVVLPPVSLTFTQTQNLIQSLARQRECDVYFWMHSDGEAPPGTAEKFLRAVQRLYRENPQFGVAFTTYDVLCACNMEAVNAAGAWDTTFTQYCADVDYYRRVEEAGFEKINTGIKVHHRPSSTIRCDPHRRHVTKLFGPVFRKYLRQKSRRG